MYPVVEREEDFDITPSKQQQFDSKELTQPAYFEVRELTQFEYSDSKGLTQHEHHDGKENLRENPNT